MLTGYDARGQAVGVIEEQRRLDGGSSVQALATVRAYNAFGDLVTETDALGAPTPITPSAG